MAGFPDSLLSFQLPSLFLKLMLPIAAAMLALTGALALVCFAKAFGINISCSATQCPGATRR